MNFEKLPQLPSAGTPAWQVPKLPIAERVVAVYEAAPAVVRSRMLTQLVVMAFESATPLVRRRLLERLIRPLGLLSLAAIAGGIFANSRLRSRSQDWPVQIDDVRNVTASDLATLVDYVQQVSVESVTGVTQLIAASPWMAGSAIASVLVTVLLRHARMAHRVGVDDEDFPVAQI